MFCLVERNRRAKEGDVLKVHERAEDERGGIVGTSRERLIEQFPSIGDALGRQSPHHHSPSLECERDRVAIVGLPLGAAALFGQELEVESAGDAVLHVVMQVSSLVMFPLNWSAQICPPVSASINCA